LTGDFDWHFWSDALPDTTNDSFVDALWLRRTLYPLSHGCSIVAMIDGYVWASIPVAEDY
jgi:hypothetical protein